MKPAITYNPRSRSYFIHMEGGDKLNSPDNMIELKALNIAQRTLIKELQRKLKVLA